MAIYRERISVGSAVKDVVEIGGGFIVNGFLGREVETRAISTPVTSASSTTEKVLAGAANNVPKLALYYLFSKVGLRGAAASSVGSIGYDVLIRLTNGGANPYDVRVTLNNQQYRILQEKLNQQAMPFWERPVESERERKYGAMPITPEVAERERKYGAMPFSNAQPAVIERQRKYGAMANFDRPANWEKPRYGSLPFEQSNERQSRQHKYGFAVASKEHSIGSLFGMQ